MMRQPPSPRDISQSITKKSVLTKYIFCFFFDSTVNFVKNYSMVTSDKDNIKVDGLISRQLSKEDEALYDRQIRLWGRAAQQKIRDAKIAIVGPLTGAAHELIKNLVLKGIGHIELVSWEGMSNLPHRGESVLFKNQTADTNLTTIVIAQAREMNSLVEFSSVTLSSRDALHNDWDTNGITAMVVVNVVDRGLVSWLDEKMSSRKGSLFWMLTDGMRATLISSLGEDYQFEEEVKSNPSGETASYRNRRIRFPNINQLWPEHREKKELVLKRRSKALPMDYCPEFGDLQDCIDKGRLWKDDGQFVEVAPVNAIIGAIVAQEIVKVTSRRDLPLHNVVMFNGEDLSSTVISVGFSEY